MIILLIGFSGCQYFAPEESQKKPLARVNQSYLYLEDIRDLLGVNTSSQDSALIIQNQINKWATQQLLIDQAKINLSLDLLGIDDQANGGVVDADLIEFGAVALK